jgi:hypothetical protein
MTVEQEDTEDLKSMIYDFGLMLCDSGAGVGRSAEIINHQS